MEILFFQKNILQDLLSSLNALISTNDSTRFITCHMIYNLAYTLILQTATTLNLATKFIMAYNNFFGGNWMQINLMGDIDFSKKVGIRMQHYAFL